MTARKPLSPDDPLADVRAAFSGSSDTDDPTYPGGPPAAEPAHPAKQQPLLSATDRVDSRAEIIAAWHADTTSTGFLHRGGYCGCRYLADRALDAIAPQAADREV